MKSIYGKGNLKFQKEKQMANPSPTIVFTVNLNLLMNEENGSLNSVTSQGVLHPDRHQSDQDNALVEMAQRKNLRTVKIGNRDYKHGDTITEYGMKAVYLRDTYGIGYAPNDRACLTVTVS